MGRRKPNKTRRPRPDRSALAALADAYRCGHCHSAVGWTQDDFGIGHINIAHDTSCPVLIGSVSPAPDMIRAAASIAGGTGSPFVVIDGDDGDSTLKPHTPL